MCFAYTTENIFLEISNIRSKITSFPVFFVLLNLSIKLMPDGIVKKYIHKNNNFHIDMLENINLPKNVCAVKSITFKPIDLMQICF